MNYLISILIIFLAIYTNIILSFKSLFIYKNNAIKLYCQSNNNNNIISYIDYQIKLLDNNDILFTNSNNTYSYTYSK